MLLARDRQGYANISRLFTLANAADRREPRLDPTHLPEHAGGVTLLTGGRDGPLSRLLTEGRRKDAGRLLHDYREWLGHDAVYVELQQNFLEGDTARNRELAGLARQRGCALWRPPMTSTTIARIAAGCNTPSPRPGATPPSSRHCPYIKPNDHLCLKPPACMKEVFRQYPEAIANTVRIAEQCDFNLATGLGYSLPDAAVPQGYTPVSYLRRLCLEAAQRRYGSVSHRVQQRLDEEFRLIERHGLAGFLLLYREIVLLAQEIMGEKGLAHPETPLEERPPGRGRGSSVALLIGYLIGISHVDPLRWGLTLERFISEDTSLLPDIDLDFPRALRDELIRRVHRRFGPDNAVLAGAIGDLLGQGHRSGPGQGPGAAQGRPEAALPAASFPRRRRVAGGDAGPARLPRLRRRPRLERPSGAGPPTDARPPQPGPARGRDGAEQFPHPGDGPRPGRGYGRPLHHGLEQGQRGRRQLRQDRPPLPAGAGPVGGSPGLD